MKYEVTNAFQDKFTKQSHEIGTVYETDDKKRATFLQENGYIGKAVAEVKETKKSKAKDEV